MSKKKTRTTKPSAAKHAAAVAEIDARIEGKARPTKAAKTTKRAKVQKASKPATPKRLSAVDAAAQVLGGSKKPMNSQQLIDEMAKRGLWKSPGGKTPSATLYAAMHRELKAKGNDARFRKVERGLFAAGKGA